LSRRNKKTALFWPGAANTASGVVRN